MTTPREPGWTEEQDERLSLARPLRGRCRGGRCPEMSIRWDSLEAALFHGREDQAVEAASSFLLYVGERADKRRGDYRDTVRVVSTVAASVSVGFARGESLRRLLSVGRGAFFRLSMRGARGQATFFRD